MMPSTRSALDLVITSSWSVESEDKTLESTVTLNTSNKRVGLEDVVQLDTCVRLIQCGETPKESCTVTVAVPEQSELALTQVVVVSEARILEVFGSCGEYLTTCSAEFVDDFEDCAVYMADCCVKPSRELLIKKAKHEDSLWVYGINLQLSQTKVSLPASSTINFQSVNDILKEAKVPLSENAEKCKAFLQAYRGVFDHIQPTKSKIPNAQTLTKMLEAGYFHPLGETGKSVSKCISNFVPFLSREGESRMSDSARSGEQCSDVLVLKTYIDQRLSQLESRIDRFEQKMKEAEVRQNEKLDCIIALLNKSSS